MQDVLCPTMSPQNGDVESAIAQIQHYGGTVDGEHPLSLTQENVDVFMEGCLAAMRWLGEHGDLQRAKYASLCLQSS